MPQVHYIPGACRNEDFDPKMCSFAGLGKLVVYLVQCPFQVPFWPHPMCGRQLFLLAPTTRHVLLFDPMCRSVFNEYTATHHILRKTTLLASDCQMGKKAPNWLHVPHYAYSFQINELTTYPLSRYLFCYDLLSIHHRPGISAQIKLLVAYGRLMSIPFSAIVH